MKLYNGRFANVDKWRLLRDEITSDQVLNELFDDKITKSLMKYVKDGGAVCQRKVYEVWDEIQEVITQHADWTLQAVEAELLKEGTKTSAFTKLVAAWSENTDAYEAKLLRIATYFEQNPQANKRLICRLVPLNEGMTISDEIRYRISLHGEQLMQRVHDDVIRMCYNGVNPKVIEKQLVKDANIRAKQAARLIRTESAKEYTKIRNQIMEDANVQEVEILVENDACELCLAEKGKVYPFHREPQVPIHVNCRCCVIPVIDLKKITRGRDDDLRG